MMNLKNYLEENNITSRINKNISKGNLYKILSNKIYIGLISHKGNDYEGEHEGIIDTDIFNKVQELLKQNRNNNKYSPTAKSPSLLAGKIFDDKGNYMSPSHSNKKGKRYRYYLSQALLQFRKEEAGSLTKIPAGEIENLVRKEIALALADKDKLQEYISDFDVHKQKTILSKASKLDLTNNFIRAILAKVILYKDKVEIIICKDRLIKGLESIITDTVLLDETKSDPEFPIKITKNIRISTTSRNGSVLVVNNAEKREVNVNQFLVKIVAKSYYWNKLLNEGKAQSSLDIQKIEKMTDNDYIKNALALRILSPKIVETILNGYQPEDLTVQKLLRIKTLDWKQQEKQLNFV